MSEEKKRKEEEEKRRRGEGEIQGTEGETSSLLPTSACDTFAPELKAYQDGQLGWWARQSVRRHVENCAHCREEMQAMREFSQRLQEGEGDGLSPQLRARILAAVPATMPAADGAVSRPRRASRLVWAWGAVASALLLCVMLSPLFLKNDNADIQGASTASKSASLEAPAVSKKEIASIATGKSVNPAGSAGGSASAESSTVGSASAAGNRAAQETSATKLASPDEEKATSFYSTPAAASAPSVSPPLTADAAGRSAGKTASPAPLAADRDAPADNVSAPATLSRSEAQKSRASKPAVLAQNRREILPVPPAPRLAAPPIVNGAADSTADAGPRQNRTETVPDTLSGTATTSESAAAATPKSVAGMRPPGAAANFAKTPAGGKMSHSLARNSAASVGNSRYRKQADSDILLLVGNVEQSRAAVNQAITSSGGTIMGVKAIPADDSKQAVTLTLDVPAKHLPALLSRLDALGERKPLASASYRTPSRIAAGKPINGVNAVTKGAATVTNDNHSNSQSQNVAPSPQHSRTKSEAVSSPASPAPAKPKPDSDFETPEARTRITIRLQKR